MKSKRAPNQLAPDFETRSASGKRDAVNEARPEERAKWHDDMAAGAVHPATPLLDTYLGEEVDKHASNQLPRSIGKYKTTGTEYADSADDFGASVEDGKLTQKGAPAHSVGNKEVWGKDRPDRTNFAMDASGGLYAGDVRTNMQESIDGGTMRRHNHSSLLGGADAAAAGTLRVDQGKVTEIADGSGHYQPAIAQTHAAASNMVASGAMDEMASSTRLVGKNYGEKELLMSTAELMAYGPEMDDARATFAQTGDKADLGRPEGKIRERHAAKSAMQAELTGADHKANLKGVAEAFIGVREALGAGIGDALSAYSDGWMAMPLPVMGSEPQGPVFVCTVPGAVAMTVGMVQAGVEPNLATRFAAVGAVLDAWLTTRSVGQAFPELASMSPAETSTSLPLPLSILGGPKLDLGNVLKAVLVKEFGSSMEVSGFVAAIEEATAMWMATSSVTLQCLNHRFSEDPMARIGPGNGMLLPNATVSHGRWSMR